MIIKSTRLLALLLLFAPTASAVEITSVYPATATVGSTVTIIGGSFSPGVRVVLGGRELIPSLIDRRQLAFVVPQLPVGEHALYLLDEQRSSSSTLSLKVKLPPPRIDTIDPANIDECSSSEERIVNVRGVHFREGARLMMNEQVVPATRENENEISFSVPPTPAGTYGIQVVNPDGSESTAHSLWLNNIPHIYDVSIGEDYVSAYQLIINGKNFNHNSTLIVFEQPPGLSDLPPQQRVITSQGGPSQREAGTLRRTNEGLQFVDCNTLVYVRTPYSRQEKILRLRVGNPDGKQTDVYELSAP